MNDLNTQCAVCGAGVWTDLQYSLNFPQRIEKAGNLNNNNRNEVHVCVCVKPCKLERYQKRAQMEEKRHPENENFNTKQHAHTVAAQSNLKTSNIFSKSNITKAVHRKTEK